MSQILTDQDFANAKRDISDIDKAVNTESIVDPRWGGDFKSLPLVSKEWDEKTQDAQTTINAWQDAITQITVNDGVPALAVSTANGNNQQAVNDLGGVDYWAARAYQTNNEVRLTDGTIVVSIIDNNSNNPNNNMTGWKKKNSADQIIDESGKTQQEINDLLLKGTASTYVITPELADISSTLNAIPTNSTVIIKNGDYTASGVNIVNDNVVIECQSDAVRITLSAGSDGVFMRFGKRGPATDYRSDNLPVYNGTIDYWDESQYSPSVSGYLRTKGSGIKGGTLILSNSNGVGGSSGLDFYRCDNPIMQTKVEWSSKFTFGNGVRVHYCKDMVSDYLDIADNENSTYAMLYYWSYGLVAGKWKIGKGSLLSIDFKHGVKSNINELLVNGNLSVGYGSLSNTINTVNISNGELVFKASKEFDVSRDLTIHDLTINNPNGNGLVPQHVIGLIVDKYSIHAKNPISISAVAFYTFSSDTGITPLQSSSEYSFDGNYRTTNVEGSITKYYEKRPTPVLKDSKFEVGSLIISTTGTQGILLTEEGGITDSMDSNGLLRKISSVPNRGFDESKRTSFTYANTVPHAFENVDLGDMTIHALNSSAINSYVLANQPVIGCKGRINFKGYDGMAWKGLWLLDCGDNLKLNIPFKRGSALSHFETNSMINTVVGGTWLCGGRVAKLIGGNATYYKDGFANHGFNVNFVYDAAPLATPPIIVDYASTQPTWKTFMSIKDCLFYRTDGVDLNTSANQVVLWTASLATGVADTSGGGYLNMNSYMDKNIPLRRYFTNSSADAAPTVTPNTIGELAQNGTTGTWWKANSLTTWAKL